MLVRFTCMFGLVSAASAELCRLGFYAYAYFFLRDFLHLCVMRLSAKAVCQMLAGFMFVLVASLCTFRSNWLLATC